MGSLFEVGRKEEGLLVLGCERQSAAFLVYISVYTELTVRRPKTGGEKKAFLWEDDTEIDSFEKQFKNVTGLTICGCIVFLIFFNYYFLQQWWQMSVKFKWKTSRTIFKWSSVGMLEGLTICPLVSGEKRSFLSFILIIKNYKAFFNFFCGWLRDLPSIMHDFFLTGGKGTTTLTI